MKRSTRANLRGSLRATVVAIIVVGYGLVLPPAGDAARAADLAPKLPRGGVMLRQSETESKIRRALSQPSDLTFNDAPLSKVAEALSARFEVPVVVDATALAADKRSSKFPITGSAPGMPLRAALRTLLAPYELDFAVVDDVLLLTTSTVAETCRHLRVYQVHDLVMLPNERAEVWLKLEELCELLTSTCDRDTWSINGRSSTGHAEVFEAAGIVVLAILHTERGHEQVAAFLNTLRAAHLEEIAQRQFLEAMTAAEVAAPTALPPGKVFAGRSANEARILAELEKPSKPAIGRMTLDELVAAVKSEHNIPVVIDTVKLQHDGRMGSDLIEVVSTEPVRLGCVLRLALREHGLVGLVDQDRFLITTNTGAENMLTSHVYPAHDLLLSSTSYARESELDRLTDLITALAIPHKWEGGGGGMQGIKYFEGPGLQAIVIEQSDDVHQQVAELFELLRRAQVPEVREAQLRRPMRYPASLEEASKVGSLGGGMY